MDHHHHNISYKEMQQMLPDYVFGRISQSEKDIFEANLEHYPDLQEEINDTKEVFRKLEKMDLDSHIQEHTRYLSYKVLNRMKDTKRSGSKSFIWRYALPLVAITAAVLLFTINGNFDKSNTGSVNSAYMESQTPEKMTILSPSDFSFLDDPSIDSKEISGISSRLASESATDHMAAVNVDAKKVDNVINNYIADNLNNIGSDAPRVLTETPGSEGELLDQMNNLDDNDLQDILKALENAELSN